MTTDPTFPASDFELTKCGIKSSSHTWTLCTPWIRENVYSGQNKGGSKDDERREKRKAKRQALAKKVECLVKKALERKVRPERIEGENYAVTVQFCFNNKRYGGPEDGEGELIKDLDNCVKGVLDGLKNGLGIDDTNFWTLLLHRHRRVLREEKDMVRVFVSRIPKPQK